MCIPDRVLRLLRDCLLQRLFRVRQLLDLFFAYDVLADLAEVIIGLSSCVDLSLVGLVIMIIDDRFRQRLDHLDNFLRQFILFLDRFECFLECSFRRSQGIKVRDELLLVIGQFVIACR